MLGRRHAQHTVDKYQRLACLEAVRRKKVVTYKDVSRWSTLPMADVVRHLTVLKSEGRIRESGGTFHTV